MSKAELLKEIAKLTPQEREEVWETLWRLEDQQLPGALPDDAEKAVLDRELSDYETKPWNGTPWEEVKARLQRPA